MKKVFVILSVLGATHMAQADLEVIQDSGITAPLSAYVDMSMLPQSSTVEDALSQAQPSVEGASIDTSHLVLPQAQTEFSPGVVTSHKVALSLPTPFYLIGGDDQSLKWVTQNASYLKEIQANGFIVDVNSMDAMKSIEAKTGLSLMPGNVEGLSSVLGTNHYPFLVYQGWVTQ